MKSTLLLMILTLAAAANAATSSCTTLYTNPNLTLCHAGDTYSQIFYNGSSASESVITQETYLKWMTEDVAALQAHTAQLAAVQAQTDKDAAASEAHHTLTMKAFSITNKKACTASGFTWTKGVCSVKDGQ